MMRQALHSRDGIDKLRILEFKKKMRDDIDRLRILEILKKIKI